MSADLSATMLGSAGSSANAGAADPNENPYEKLSREVHQMQLTGAIHHDWLENPRGFLLKPDFKRRLQHVGAGGRKLNSSRMLRIHLPGSSYRRRWFVLDGMILRYFKSENEDTELGEIHLASVNAVLPSSVADAPEHALDLVCADRIYTVAGNDREDMVRWATVLTLVLRGEYKPKLMQRPESTIIRGSAAMPRASRRTSQHPSSRFTDAPGMRITTQLQDDNDKSQEDDVKEKIITVTFEQAGSLDLLLRGTVDDEVMVCGFATPSSGRAGLAEASGVIKVGDLLISVNNHYFTNIEFQQAIDLIQQAGRPLTLRFSRVDSPAAPSDHTRVAEGWILAKEPAAHRYRIRMLQLNGTKLHLFKPSMQGGRADRPCVTINMDEITDIRPINDTREAVSAFTQCYPKQWGITLEGTRSMFTFYTRDKEEMMHWVDLLKNCPLFANQSSRLSIPVHAIATVEFNEILEPKVVLQDDVGKLGDLIPTLAVYHFMLLEDSEMLYFVDKSAAESRSRPVGRIRCDAIVSIVPSFVCSDADGPNIPGGTLGSFVNATTSEQEPMPWRLELGIMMGTSSHRSRRSLTLCFDDQEKMMKWGGCIGREAKRLTGQEYDLSSVTRRPSRSNSSAYAAPSAFAPDAHATPTAPTPRVITNPLKFSDPRAQEVPPLYRSLKDVANKSATRGWFFVKKPGSHGFASYHPRFVVLHEHELMLFKYEVEEGTTVAAATVLDLRTVKDVREADSGFRENIDFSIQLTTTEEVVWVLVAETYTQKEAWLSVLIWISDYYFRGATTDHAYSTTAKTLLDRRIQVSGLMEAITEADDEVDQAARSGTTVGSEAEANALQGGAPSPATKEGLEMRGALHIGGRSVFGAIANGVFSHYDKEEDYWDEWGDVVDAISLKEVEDVHSDGFQEGSFVIKVKNEHEVQLVAESAQIAKRWMLVMCSCGELILKKAPRSDSWASTQPKEARIWKLDRLYQVFRRRYFSLRNHQLIFYTEEGGRPLGMVSLPCIYNLTMSKVITRSKDQADFYQLEIGFAMPGSPDQPVRDDQVGDFYALSLAFDDEESLRDWAGAIYDCCTNSMSIKANATLSPLGNIQVLPQELLKTCNFEQDGPKAVADASATMNGFSASGWLYYRTSNEERIRARYFVQWGYELSIYKHEVLAEEATAIRYGVIDCRALVDVRFAYINSPENAVELILGSGISVIIIPRTDDEAVMWRNALLDVKRAYGCLESGESKTEICGSGVFISRGSTFSSNKDNEELLRTQIEASVVYSSNLQEWDGTKWIPKYFVLTTSRVLVLSLALHLYDEEPDILGSFATKDVTEVRSCSDSEDAETGHSQAACVITVSSSKSGQPDAAPQERYVLKCDSIDHCLEWMRLLCTSNGKLELKKNAATSLWGSVNRVASLSRHSSFRTTTASALSPLPLNGNRSNSSRRLSRIDATRRRTSELIMSRTMSLSTISTR